MATIGEGHERAAQSYQDDGLLDQDILTSPTLTNFNERGLLNGVVPILLNDINDSNRNSSTVGNCAVSHSSTTLSIAAGTVLLDGVFHSIGSASIDITSSSHTGKFPKNSSTLPTLTGANYERILLVYVDPAITGKIAMIYGNEVNTGSGVYPQSPSAHLDKQTIVLAAVRLTYSSGVAVGNVNDKRVFLRPGPLPLSALINSGNSATSPVNTLVTNNTGNLPITDMGFVFARDPTGLGSYPNGAGETHLFFQSDQATSANVPSESGAAYQITPVHRTSIKTASYNGSSTDVVLAFEPLGSQDEASTKLVEVMIYKTGTPRFIANLVQGSDFTISNRTVTINGSLGYTGTPTNAKITYVHAGHE